MTKPKYTGKLATTIPKRLLLAAALDEYYGKGNNDFLFEQRTGRLMLLLDHYEIARTDPLCWLKLAWRLAIDHVPGFRVSENPRGRGRPRKHSSLRQLAPKRKRGRPSKEIDPERFVRVIDAAKQEHSAAKNRRVTDKEVLEIIFEKIAKKEGRSAIRAKSKELPKLQKRLSRARRNSNKSN